MNQPALINRGLTLCRKLGLELGKLRFDCGTHHILYHSTTWVSMCGCNSDSASVQILFFLLIGFARPGGLYHPILYPKSARTHWVRIWHFRSPNSMTFFTLKMYENVGFPMGFYGEVNLRQDTTRCVSAGEALRSPRPTPPRPQSATAAATGGALPSGYLT